MMKRLLEGNKHSKRTHVSSTISKDPNHQSFNQPSAKFTNVSRNSQFSINSNDYGESSNFSNNLKEGRATVYNRNVKLFQNQDSDKSKSVINKNKQEAKARNSPPDFLQRRPEFGKSSNIWIYANLFTYLISTYVFVCR